MLNEDWMNSFICDDCGLQFNNIRNFMNHRRFHFKFLPSIQPKGKVILEQVCPHCNLSSCPNDFINCIINETDVLKNKDQHQRLVDESELKLKRCRYCFKCKYEFQNADEYLKHSKEFHGVDRPFQCKECDFSTSAFYSLKRHSNVHKDTKLYTCHLCPKGYASKASLDGHLLEHSEVNIKSHDCEICGKKFPIPSLLKRHLRRHSDAPSKRSFKCNLCPKDFIWKKSLKLHMFTHTGEKPYQCLVCNKSFAELSKYRQHMHLHNQIMGKTINCGFCEKRFLTPYLLKRHMIVHDENKARYKCDVCSKPFLWEVNLNLHKRTHTGDLPYSCEDCNEKFKNRSAYNRHRIIHINPNNNPVSCEHCGKEFSTMYKLKIHIKIHTSTDVYKCNICSKSFTRKQTLKDHLLLHEGKEPFSCMHCGKKFLKQTSLKRHLDPDKSFLVSFNCSECPSTFINKGCYEFHRKTHKEEYFCKICSKTLTTANTFKNHIKRHASKEIVEPYEQIIVKEEM